MKPTETDIAKVGDEEVTQARPSSEIETEGQQHIDSRSEAGLSRHTDESSVLDRVNSQPDVQQAPTEDSSSEPFMLRQKTERKELIMIKLSKLARRVSRTTTRRVRLGRAVGLRLRNEQKRPNHWSLTVVANSFSLILSLTRLTSQLLTQCQW